MAYQSELELRVKVNDVEIERLEKRIARLNTKPGLVAGKASSVLSKQLRLRKGENQLIKNNLDLQNKVQQAAVRELNTRTQFVRLFKDAAKIRASYAKDADRAAKSAEREAAAAQKTAAANRKQRIQGVQGAVAGGVISAAFPILTGGGAAESVLGGAGGLLGSLAGPLGSFAGGIGGSAIGRLITDAEELNKSLAGLNVRLGTTGSTAGITAKNIDELAKSLSLAKEETVDLLAEFTRFGDAAAATELAAAFGPIGGADTYQKILDATKDTASLLKTIQGVQAIIGPQKAQELLDVLETKGAEQTRIELATALLSISQQETLEKAKQVGFADQLNAATQTLINIRSGDPTIVTGQDIVDKRVANLREQNRTFIDELIKNNAQLDTLFRELGEKYKPEKTPRAGRAPAALPQSKELQLRQQILKTELSLADIETKRRALRASDLGVINLQDKALYDRLTTEIQILELARQQALVSSKVPEDAVLINNLYDQRLEKLQRENDLQREQNLLRGEQIKLQQALTALRNEQQTEGVVRGLKRNIEDASFRDSVDSSASEMLALRIKQLRRREDLIGSITNKIKEQDAIIDSGDVKKIPAAKKELEVLKNRKAAIEALLPVLNQVEQAELRQNQLMEKYGFIANEAATAMSSAVQSIVTGTGSVEQAFSDMFANIGKAFIDMATQMIAQALFMKAVGILTSAFGGGGSSPGIQRALDVTPKTGAAATSTLNNFLSPRANGGPVSANTPYIVGERGPELFIPGANGSITNNDQFEAARKAMGGGDVGSSSAFDENAEAIAVANSYTRERVMERERNENNFSTGSMVIETQVINNVEYASVEQVEKATAASAEQARAKVYRELRNKPAVRSSVGLR